MAFWNVPTMTGVDPTDGGFEPGFEEKSLLRSLFGNRNQGSTFIQGVVCEVITDPELLWKLIEEVEEYSAKLANPQLAKQAPRNSIIVKLIGDDSNDKMGLVLPFFSSHVLFPICVGELVWMSMIQGQPYWFSRVAGNGSVEDVNFSHKDREFITPAPFNANAQEKKESSEGSSGNAIPFNNDGIGTERNFPIGFDPNTLLSNAQISKQVVEPVPRWSPRMGDLVLQGSNNTLISLGTDRGWKKDDSNFDASNSSEESEPGRGSIDIVVGRGWIEDDAKETNKNTKGADPERTKPRLVETGEGKLETDKISRLNDQDPNSAEGDPDFHIDASRIYISTNSAIDEKLTLKGEYRKPFDGSYDDMETASIAMKSNEIRIIAREDGSVRIVKEKGDKGKVASIVLMANGEIHIQGETIYFGEPGGPPPPFRSEGEGKGKSEPYVLHHHLEDWCKSVSTSIETFCQTLMSHTTPGYGVPSPQITSAATTLLSEMIQHDIIIPKFPSKRIFGE